MKVEHVAKVQKLGGEGAEFNSGNIAADERRIVP